MNWYVWTVVAIVVVFIWARLGWIELGTERSLRNRPRIAGVLYGVYIAPAALVFLVLFAFRPRK